MKRTPSIDRKLQDLAQDRAKRQARLALDGVHVSEKDASRYIPNLSWDSDIEFEFLRTAARDNFWTFFLHAWGAAHSPHAEDWLSKRAQIGELMANWFQEQIEQWQLSRRLKEDKQRRIMVVVTREFGKTTLFTRAGLLWCHLIDPDLSTYIGSDNKENAIARLKTIKPVLDGTDKYALFARMYGSWYNSDLTWTREEVVHSARTLSTRTEPSFGVWGVETGITGKHPDILALDDPNSYERMQSDSNWLETVNEHCASISPALTADGLLMYVGTPYGDNDNLRAALKRDGIATLTGVPMADFKEREGGLWHVLHIPGRFEDGAPTCPRVWPDDRMKQYEKENPDKYAAQVLLRPELSEHVPLTREQVEDCVVDEAQIPLKMLRFTMHLDTAFKDLQTKKRLGDESVIQIWGHLRDGSGDVVFIEGVGSNLWRGEQFYEQVVLLLQKYRRLGRKILCVTDEVSPGKQGSNRIMLESFCNGKGFAAPPVIEINRAGQNKMRSRILPATTYWADGHVRIIRDAPGSRQLIEQMSRITPSTLR